MIFCVETECKEAFSFDAGKTGRQVAETVLEQETCPYDCGVNVLLTDDAQIRILNKEHRGIDDATDVLSFPSLTFDKPAAFAPADTLDLSAIDPETGCVWLGDIVISVEKTKRQAETYGHSVLREYAFLIAHSMLHLIGYDHETDEERLDMEERQERALQTLHITRDMAS